MVEEIRQELSFDASGAIKTLALLDKAMETYDKRLLQSVKAMKQFNQTGGKTTAALKRISKEATRTAAALSAVATKSAQVATQQAGATAQPAIPQSDVDKHIRQLQSMFQVSERATVAQKRSFQSAVTSAAEFASKNQVAMGQVSTQAKNLDKNFTGVANNMANKLQRIASASKKNLNEAGQATRRLTVDFQTMVRIISTQVIVRALSSIRQLLSGAVSEATKFQTSIAEIGTIAPIQDLDELGERVRAISDEFNTPLDTTAKGYYQTISNQIGDAVEEFDAFVAASAKFAKTSVTDLASAVNLGSGTLNAFGKEASDAEEVFSKFFVTIKQGRVVGQELAQGFGTVAPIAAKLNVEFEELNAALATITIQGVAADKAFTQLRGIFNSFLKPTKEMSEALKELGFESGEQILKAFDLQESLELVVGTTDGSAEAVGKLIPRIRGLTGGLALLSDESDHFTETLELQKTALDDIYGQGYDLVIETDAQKVTKELNKLKNFMTTEFGEGILQASGRLLQLVGGADQLTRILSSVGTVIPTVVIGIGALGTALAVMALKAKVASGSVTTLQASLVSLIALVPAAMAAGDFIGNLIADSWTREQETFAKLLTVQAKERERKIARELASEKDKVRELEELYEREFAVARKQWFQLSDAAVDANKDQLSTVKFFTNAMINDRARYHQQVKQAAESTVQSVYDSERRVAGLRQDLDDRIFKHRTDRLNETQKVYKFVERADRLARDAAGDLAQARSEDQRASAAEEFSRATAFAEQAIQIAEQTGNRGLEAKALSTLEDITRRNISAEQAYQLAVQKTQKQLQRDAQTEENRVERLRQLQTDLLDSYRLFDKETGELLGSDERAEKLRSAQGTLEKFIKEAQAGKPLDVSQMLDFAKLSQKMAGEVSDFRVAELQATDQSLQNLHNQVQEALTGFFVEVPAAKALTDATGIEITGPESQAAAMEAYSQQANEAAQNVANLATATGALSDKEKQLENAFQAVQDQLGSRVLASAIAEANTEGSRNKEVFAGMAEVIALAGRSLEGSTVSMEEFQEANDNLLDGAATQTEWSNRITGNLKADVALVHQFLGELIGIQRQIEQLPPVAEPITDTKGQQIFQKPKTDAQGMSTAVGDTTASTVNAVQPTSVLAGLWESIARNARLAATAAINPGASPAGAAMGGRIRHLASGGFARGTDQIPAMLSEGEHVTNAKSSRRFAAQLSAIGAGIKPVFRESGGTVTSVGDVSININESKTPQQTARQVMAAFRRESRRGSGKV